MRADTKQARQPEKPGARAVLLIGRGKRRDDAKVASFYRGVDLESCGVPVVEAPVEQRKEQKKETALAIVIDHQADAEFPSLTIEEQQKSARKNQREWSPH